MSETLSTDFLSWFKRKRGKNKMKQSEKREKNRRKEKNSKKHMPKDLVGQWNVDRLCDASSCLIKCSKKAHNLRARKRCIRYFHGGGGGAWFSFIGCRMLFDVMYANTKDHFWTHNVYPFMFNEWAIRSTSACIAAKRRAKWKKITRLCPQLVNNMCYYVVLFNSST